MKNLKKILREISVKGIEEGKELNLQYNTGYDGLKLIDEKVHAGGTSVKYWM